MSDDRTMEEFVERIQRLGISAEDKAFLIRVRRQFEADVAAHERTKIKPPTPPEGH